MKREKNFKNRLCAVLLCLCMALTLLPASAFAALDEAASLTVDGTALVTAGEVTEETVAGATYDKTTNTLTLAGYGGEWNAAGPVIAENMGDSFTIALPGLCYFDSLTVVGDVTFTGIGGATLYEASGPYGVSVTGALTLDGPDVHAYGGGLTYVEGEEYASAAVTSPTDLDDTGAFRSKQYLRVSAITPALRLCGVNDTVTGVMTYGETADLSGDDTGTGWTYTKSANTLALNNYVGGAIYAEGMGNDFKITLTGTNALPATGKDYNPLMEDQCCVVILYTPLTTVSGSGSLTSDYTLAVIEGSLTIASGTVTLGSGLGTAMSSECYEGIALWNDSDFGMQWFSTSQPVLTIGGTANVKCIGYYNGVMINTYKVPSGTKGLGKLVVSGGRLECTGAVIDQGVEVDGDVAISGGLVIARGSPVDGYQANGAQGVLANGDITISGGSLIADGYNSGIDAGPNGSLTVSDTGFVLATGRTVLGAGVTAPAISPKPDVAAEEKYSHVNINGLSKVGEYGDAKCVIGGFEVSVGSLTNGALTPDITRAGEGMAVTVAVAPDIGYKLSSLKYSGGDPSGETVISADANGVYSFTMPAYAVTLTAEFVPGTATTTTLTAPQENPEYDGEPTAFTGTFAVKYNSGAIDVPGAAVTYTYATDQAGPYGDVRPQNADTYYVKARFAGDSEYAASESAAMEFTIDPKTPTITLSGKTATYTRSAVSVTTPSTESGTVGGGISWTDVPTGEVTVSYYTAYTDEATNTPTTPENSGAASVGAAPVNADTYYAVATIAAEGNYGAATSGDPVTVTINRRAITSSMVSNIDPLTYTGLPQTPSPTVRHSADSSAAVLTLCSIDHEHDGTSCDGDYYLTYADNTDAWLYDGVNPPELASVTVHGVGNYKDGTTPIKKDFIIQPYDITENTYIASVTGGWLYDGRTRSGPVTVTFTGANGETPTATATGTVASALGGTYTTVNLSNVAIANPTDDNNYYYHESYIGVSTGVSVVITGVGVTISDTAATDPAVVALTPNQGRIVVGAPTVTGANEYSVTVRGASALEAFMSASLLQQDAEHEWVGLLIGDFSVNGVQAEDITALQISSDGESYVPLTSADITESAALGGTAKQFVLWLKTDEVTSRSIWLKDGSGNQVKLNIAFTPYVPPAPYTPPAITVPVTGADTVKATATVTDGKATVDITDAQLEAVLGSGADNVSVDASSLEKVSEVAVPAKAIDAIVKAGGASLTVETKTGSVSLDADTLKAAARSEGELRVVVEQIPKAELSGGQRAQLGENAVVLDLQLWKGDTQLHSFNGGEATVGIPYSGEPAEGMIVWRMTADAGGKIDLEPISVAVNREKSRYEFVTGRFSEYVLARFPFTDVGGEKWYYEDAVYAYVNGLFDGTGDTSFEPETAMSRAMLVTVLWRLEGSPAPSGACSFTDLTADWYKNAVAWAAENEIVMGYDAAHFGPDDDVTREQTAAALYRYEQYKGGGLTGDQMLPPDFPDADEVSDWACEGMCWCVTSELIAGSDGQLLPKGNAERAQVAALLHRFIEGE